MDTRHRSRPTAVDTDDSHERYRSDGHITTDDNIDYTTTDDSVDHITTDDNTTVDSTDHGTLYSTNNDRNGGTPCYGGRYTGFNRHTGFNVNRCSVGVERQ